jgi:hypothetical protein
MGLNSALPFIKYVIVENVFKLSEFQFTCGNNNNFFPSFLGMLTEMMHMKGVM